MYLLHHLMGNPSTFKVHSKKERSRILWSLKLNKACAQSLVASLPQKRLVVHLPGGQDFHYSLTHHFPIYYLQLPRIANSIVFIPSAFTCGTLFASDHLGDSLVMITLPLSWVIASMDPLTLCSMTIQDGMNLKLYINIECSLPFKVSHSH